MKDRTAVSVCVGGGMNSELEYEQMFSQLQSFLLLVISLQIFETTVKKKKKMKIKLKRNIHHHHPQLDLLLHKQ